MHVGCRPCYNNLWTASSCFGSLDGPEQASDSASDEPRDSCSAHKVTHMDSNNKHSTHFEWSAPKTTDQHTIFMSSLVDRARVEPQILFTRFCCEMCTSTSMLVNQLSVTCACKAMREHQMLVGGRSGDELCVVQGLLDAYEPPIMLFFNLQWCVSMLLTHRRKAQSLGASLKSETLTARVGVTD